MNVVAVRAVLILLSMANALEVKKSDNAHNAKPVIVNPGAMWPEASFGPCEQHTDILRDVILEKPFTIKKEGSKLENVVKVSKKLPKLMTELTEFVIGGNQAKGKGNKNPGKEAYEKARKGKGKYGYPSTEFQPMSPDELKFAGIAAAALKRSELILLPGSLDAEDPSKEPSRYLDYILPPQVSLLQKEQKSIAIRDTGSGTEFGIGKSAPEAVSLTQLEADAVEGHEGMGGARTADEEEDALFQEDKEQPSEEAETFEGVTYYPDNDDSEEGEEDVTQPNRQLRGSTSEKVPR